MADKTYVTAIGFVQFDPNVRDANGKEVTDVTIKTPGGDGKNIRITIWPELILTKPLEKGDLVAVDGSFTTESFQGKDGEKRTSLQISAYTLNVNGTKIERADREVVQGAQTSGGSESSAVPF